MSDIDARQLWQDLCELAGQGEKLRVVHQFQDGIPLDAADQEILNRSATMGEHIESGRVRLLRTVRHAFPGREQEFVAAVMGGINEGGSKP